MPINNINSNEIELLKKVMIGLMIITFGSAIFAYFTGGSLPINCNSGQTCPLRQLNNTETNISLTGNALSKSFNTQLFATNSSTASLTNIITIPINFIYGISIFMYNLMIMLGLSIYIILFILFALIPSLFTTAGLGYFSYIFITIYGFTIIVISGYALLLIYNKVIPIISGLIGLL